jgi:hypothetical protein
MRESGGNARAFNGNATTGDKSYGLFQINMLGGMGPARMAQYGLPNEEALFDPATNAKVAFKMSKGGTDFGAWGLGPNAYHGAPAAAKAAYEEYLTKFPGAGGGPQISGIDETQGLGLPSVSPAGVPPLPSKLSQLLQNAAPSPAAVNLLAPLGGIAAKTAAAAQAPIPMAQPQQPQAQAAPAAGPSDSGQQQDPYNPVPLTPIEGATHGGEVPMVMGGNIKARYPNLQVQGNADWQHINPRLLMILQKEAEKRGVAIVINSGYRSTAYNQKIGGAENSNHRKGLAVDAYINGHPIGEVIPPEEWARLGVRSGNTPGFFKGNPDPEHLDLAGIPVKGGGR